MQIKDKAILVGLELTTNNYSMKESLDELEYLALAVDILTVDKVVQRSNRVYPKYYIGAGKVIEIKHLIDIHEATMVIFDDALSPSQIKNLEHDLDIQVIDRSFLILQIFALRAQSRQSMLEVSLAQKEYMLPRLIGLGLSLSRQAGSSGSFSAKGPGETKLEMDRRKLQDEIIAIKRELKIISKEIDISRSQRVNTDIPIVSLVGYTNVGKSSLMNSLSEKLTDEKDLVFEKDMLFATLDTKTKRMKKENYPPFLLTDTVGFIRKLPKELVRSFESTLKDVINADLLLIVADGNNFQDYQISETVKVLNQIGAKKIPRITVLTKSEITKDRPYLDDDYIFLSNVTKEGIDDLITAIYGHIYLDSKLVTLKIPYNESKIFNHIRDNGTLISTEYYEEGYIIKAILPKTLFNKYQNFIIT